MTDLELFDLYKHISKVGLGASLRDACTKGDLNEVKFLLTSPMLSIHADIHHNDDDALFAACDYGRLDVITYLLTSPELKEHANIHASDDIIFHIACENGNLEVVKLLVAGPQLKEHVDIHVKDDIGFRAALSNNQLDVLRFFIFDMDIQRNVMIDSALKTQKSVEVENWFTLREVNKELNTNLDKKDINIIKKAKM